MDFFCGELVSFVLLCLRDGLDPLGILGSWAGAFGWVQFMPSSYLDCAVDYDGDGQKNLFVMADAVASSANFLKCRGWKAGDFAKQEKALTAYNGKDYAKATLAYADALR